MSQRPKGQHITDAQAAELERRIRRGEVPVLAARAVGVGPRSAWRIAARLRGEASGAGSSTSAPEVPTDPVAMRRLKDDVTRLRTASAALERRVADAEEFRASILNLAREPLRPRLVVPTAPSGGGGRTLIAHLSDVHRQEVVSLSEMDGANSYSSPISRARLGRFFGRIAALATDHWSGSPPDELILCLGGDMIGGAIHQELAETNDVAVPRAVRDLGEDIAGGLLLWRSKVNRPIRVYSVPGNHGRLTIKPTAKRRAAHNLDLLVADFAEAALRGAGVNDVTFHATASPDAYFSTYAFHWCLNHGDTMGSKGGQGYIGPAATIIRGHRKLVDTAWRVGRPIHYVLTAHFHTTLRTTFGWANGSLIGYGEYARDLRADPEPAKQNMLVVHERLGVIDHQEIYVGHPAEGSHYAGPATVIRPTWEDVA